MHRQDVSSVKEYLKGEGIKFFEAGFLDLEGNLRSRLFPIEYLDKILLEGYGFDGYSTGFVNIEDSDLLAIPDINTLKIIDVGEVKTAFFICDIYRDDKPLEIYPRYALRKMLDELSYRVMVGVEPEFYILSKDRPMDEGFYMSSPPEDQADLMKRKIIDILWKSGIKAILTHHEVGPGQHEITIPAADPVTMGDNYVFFKKVVKTVAFHNGYFATFMPKPFEGLAGNGLHFHINIWRNGESLFGKDGELAEEVFHYMGGLLKYAPGISLYTNPTVNSYKRLVPGFEAPIYTVWGRGNRSVLIRIPCYRSKGPIRIEYRSPDSSGNIYLAFMAVIWAGNRGLVEKIDPGEECRYNVYHRKEANVKVLPKNLEESINNSIREAAPSIYERFISIKKREWEEYMRYCRENGFDPHSISITKWEVKKYFNR